MKIILSFLCVSVLAVACSDSVESFLPQPEQQATVVADETGTVVSEAQAIDVAQAFFLNQAGDGLKTRSAAGAFSDPASVQAIRADEGEPIIHVLNYPEGGWALVSATRNYYPVLAYSDEGSFELREDMGAVDVWISETREAIRDVESFDAKTKFSIRAAWVRLDPALAATFAPKTRAGYYNQQLATAMSERIGQLDRQYGYDGWSFMSLINAEYYLDSGVWSSICNEADAYSSPIEYTIIGLKFDNSTYRYGPYTTTVWHQNLPYNFDCSGQPVGCVPVAMAQIMKFFGKPARAGSLPNFLSYPPLSTPLSQLLKEVGESVGIEYTGSNSSNSTIGEAEDAFESYGYTVTKSSHNYETVKNWISTGKPVFMAGHRDWSLGVGHAWVCDGVDYSDSNTTYCLEFVNSYGSYFTPNSSFTPDYPGSIYQLGGTSFHHNWGNGPNYIGWYGANNVNMAPGKDYKYNRNNLYVTP